MRKFQVTIRFDMNDEFAALVPPHRIYINRLIEQGIIDHYVVTMETQRVWITFSAETRKDVERYLAKSPLSNTGPMRSTSSLWWTGCITGSLLCS